MPASWMAWQFWSLPGRLIELKRHKEGQQIRSEMQNAFCQGDWEQHFSNCWLQPEKELWDSLKELECFRLAWKQQAAFPLPAVKRVLHGQKWRCCPLSPQCLKTLKQGKATITAVWIKCLEMSWAEEEMDLWHQSEIFQTLYWEYLFSSVN